MQQCSLLLRKKEKLLLNFCKILCSCCLTCMKMETEKIVNLLNDSENESLKFATTKWYVNNDQNNGQYGRGNKNNATIILSHQTKSL